MTKETNENQKIPERTYNEIAAENDYLGKRVVELLEQLQLAEIEIEKKKVELVKMENEKKEKALFDGCWISNLIGERNEERECKMTYMKQLDECKQRIKQLEGERDNPNERNTRNDEIVAEHDRYNDEIRDLNLEQERNTKTLKEIPMEKQKAENSSHTNFATKDSEQERLPCTNDSGIEIDLEEMTRELKNQVDIYVDKKLSGLGLKTSKEMNANEERVPSGTCANNDEKRKLNIIIHGLEENIEGDEVSIKKIFDAMNMEIGTALAHRLGAKKENQARPVKMVMRSENDKDLFMSKLWMLKHKFNQKIRVTDDYTWEEREEIRRWVKMADERNGKNNDEVKTNYKWKVRGTPKTGMRIVQIRI